MLEVAEQAAFGFAVPPVGPVKVWTPLPAKQARPYQVECWDAFRSGRDRGVRRMLAVLWPSLGKSYIAAHLPAQLGLHRMLALAHRKELIDQLAAELHEANPDATIGIEQGERRDGHDDCDIVVGSVPTLHRDSRREKFGRPFDVVFLDECDLGLAPTFLKTLTAFGAGLPGGPLLIGMTGWFKRHDKKKAATLFDEVVYEKSIVSPDGKSYPPIDEGWVVPHRAVRVYSKTDISKVAVFGGEFSQPQLAKAVDTPDLNDLIVSTICNRPELADRRSILVFVTSVHQAETIAAMLRDSGQTAQHICATTSAVLRPGIFRNFAEGRTRVLVNVDVVGRGNNIPRIDCVFMGHPTKSATRYIQSMSRGGRPCPGKQDVLVVDVAFVCGKHRIQSASQVFGVRDCDALGQDLRQVATVVKRAEATGTKLTEHDTIADVTAKLKRRENYLANLPTRIRKSRPVQTQATAVDLFGNPVSTPRRQPEGPRRLFPWLTVGDGSQFVLEVDRGSWAIVERSSPGQHWAVRLTRDGKPVADEALTTTAFADPDWQKADAFVKRHAGHWKPPGYQPRNEYDVGIPRWKFLQCTAPKRHRPATENQCLAIRKFGQPVPDGLSFGAASDLLSQLVWHARARGAHSSPRG